MATRKKKPEPPPPEPAVRVIETFRKPDAYWLSQLNTQPSCFNGVVSVEKYRITIEKVGEEVGVLEARLLKLWRETDNHHNRQPLRSAAAKLGIVLPDDQWGADRKRT